MVNDLVGAIVHILTYLGLIWLILAMLSRWQFFKSFRQGYEVLVKQLVLEAARFLWTPRFERSGGGHMASASVPYPEDLDTEEFDEEEDQQC